jgi:outer membrane protein OmpA-like peptidoglycan-associated protein
MKDAAQWGFVASIAGVLSMLAVGVASAADVTDADRGFSNYTRETATVPDGEVRLEVRGFSLHDDKDPRLNIIGLPLLSSGPEVPVLIDHDTKVVLAPSHRPNDLTGGTIELLGSYGLGKNAEVGFLVPGLQQKVEFADGTHESNFDVGDLLVYTKFQHSVAEHCSVGAGVELTMPNGPKSKGLGTGEFGMNPVVSTRYQRGRFGVGLNVGYTLYTGSASDVFNYGAEVILRANDMFALRAEIAERVFNTHGSRFNDLTVLPGLDINLSRNVVIRPEGLANGTNTALDWGVGLGIAMSFAAPSIAFAQPAPVVGGAAPPEPIAVAAAPPAREKIVLRGVHFDFNKATIRPDARPILDQAAAILKEHSGVSVTVEGHTDAIGSDEYNQRLSVRRATAVGDYLTEHGVDAERMSAVGRGKTKPVASNDSEDGRAQNRRVELIVAD